MLEMKLEAGKCYRTRHGHKAFIRHILKTNPLSNTDLDFPVSGVMNKDNAMTWTDCGRYNDDGIESIYDLVAEWQEPKRLKGWLNIYCWNEDGRLEAGAVYPDRVTADSESASNRKACIEIDVPEGQGL